MRAEDYRDRWARWVTDPLLKSRGLVFDPAPADVIKAPAGKVRVCAWHIDFDERPTCWLDVETAEEARFVCENLFDACGWNVDFATAHDETGVDVVRRPY